MEVSIYTDGSCNTQLRTGAWASIILFANEKIVLHGVEVDVTHHHMELQAVINSILYLEEKSMMHHEVNVYSDSQYVVDLVVRKDKLKDACFKTKAGVAIRNVARVQQLIHYIDRYRLHFVKLKAHAGGNLHQHFNREVDMFVRRELRRALETLR